MSLIHMNKKTYVRVYIFYFYKNERSLRAQHTNIQNTKITEFSKNLHIHNTILFIKKEKAIFVKIDM